jgi:hypothetical protein
MKWFILILCTLYVVVVFLSCYNEAEKTGTIYTLHDSGDSVYVLEKGTRENELFFIIFSKDHNELFRKSLNRPTFFIDSIVQKSIFCSEVSIIDLDIPQDDYGSVVKLGNTGLQLVFKKKFITGAGLNKKLKIRYIDKKNDSVYFVDINNRHIQFGVSNLVILNNEMWVYNYDNHFQNCGVIDDLGDSSLEQYTGSFFK